jgi:hypothetical protein
MSFQKILSVFVVAAALAAPGAASAVDVEITFENKHASKNATYSHTTAIENTTYANANPKPLATVQPGVVDTYTVGNPLTSLVTSAQVVYTINDTSSTKKCIFHTSFTLPSSGIPNWTKNATSNGGAICTANITYTDANTHNWRVTFTMK